VSAGRSFLVSALDRVSLFAHKMGLRLMAGQGKVEIQAQSDDLEIIAEKVASLISSSGEVRFSSPREILLSAGGSYIRISAEGVEKGTTKQWKVHSASQTLSGPRSEPWLTRDWKDGEAPQDLRPVVRDELGRYLNLERYAKQGTADIPAASAEHTLILFHEGGGMEAEASLERSGPLRGFAAAGTTLRIRGEHSDE
jgi:uncharacterized protein (DUF2345 family)